MKTVIVTGASRGIGKAIALHFGRNGYNVVVNFHSKYTQAKEVVNQIIKCEGQAVAIQADVSDYNQVEQMVNTTIEKYGSIDVLINNAGISLVKMLQDTTEADFDSIMSVNVKGVFNCTKAVIRHMLTNEKGSIVNISSVWGSVGASCESVYSASKGAVNAFTKSISKETGLSGIRVNAVAAGLINTDMNSHLSQDDIEMFVDNCATGRMGKPEEVARIVYAIADNDTSSYLTGQIINIDGGI